MIRAIIVEDEKRNLDELTHMVTKYCPGVDIIGVSQTVKNAIDAIKDKKPDLVFLDIELPDGTGFQILENVKEQNIGVIFVTAYEHYAIKAIKACALDYLLKPIDIDELVNAVNKVKTEANLVDFQKRKDALFYNSNQKDATNRKIALPTLEGLLFIFEEEIVYCEADNNYTNFYLKNNERIIVCRPLGYFEELLDENSFCRCHQSYLVNIVHAKKYIKGRGGHLIMFNGAKVEVSERLKSKLLERFNK